MECAAAEKNEETASYPEFPITEMAYLEGNAWRLRLKPGDRLSGQSLVVGLLNSGGYKPIY